VSVVANVAINIDSRGAEQRLKAIQRSSENVSQALKALQGSASAVKTAIETQQGGFARASTVQGVFSARVLNTEKAIRTQIAALRDVQSSVKLGGALYQKAATQIKQYEDALRGANAQETKASGSASNLIGVIGKLGVAYVGLRTAQEAIQAGIQREESERRLQFLAKGYGEVAQAQEIAARAGAKFGLSATESNQQFAQLYGRLRPLNISIQDIETAFVGFNTAAKVSGATSAESAGAFLQLTQALGSGVLRGQELNSILEQAPGLVVALTKELGRPVSEIRKLAEQGEITSDVVIRALKRAGTDGADELAAAMQGPAQQVKNLQNEFENFQVAATKELLPQIIESVRVLTASLRAIAPIIRTIGAVAGPVIKYLNGLIERATGVERIRFRAQAVQRAGESRLSKAGVGRTYSDAQGNIYSTITGRLVQAASPRPTGDGAAIGLTGGGESDGGKSKKEKMSDAAREAKRLAEELKRSLEIGDQLGTQFSRQVVLLDTASETERQRLQIQFDYEDRAKQIAELKNAEQRLNLTTLNDEIKRLETSKLQTDELKKQIEEYYKLAGLTAGEMLGEGAGAFRTDINLDPNNRATEKADELKRKFNELIDPINMAATGAQSIGDAFGTAFQSIITGAQSTQQALAGFFKSVGESFINMATEIIAQMVVMYSFKQLLGLFGGGGGGLFSGAGPVAMPGGAGFAEGFSMPKLFAKGGFVTGPTNALIGEGGEPEYVIPASKMRGAMSRYSAGARGSGVIPSGSGDGATMGATMTAAPIDVRYTVERINSVDYVTADQFQAGMAQAAQQGAAQGETRALRKLQMSNSTRRRVGI
jgi:tape measure domain-containing protein